MIVPLVMVLNTAATVGIVLFTKFLYSHDVKFPTTLLFSTKVVFVSSRSYLVHAGSLITINAFHSV